ncbi:hypothetical protein HMI55_005714 [Coelomomyces lativittatus]|nr:hypothetical protein HMI55_005714 [Coelomomyces lativittatus]
MVVHLHVYDKDMCSHDDFLGRLEIPLQWCLEQGSWESWLNLMNQVNEKCGEVYLKVVPKGTFVGRPLPTMA